MTKKHNKKFASSIAGLLTAVCIINPAFVSSALAAVPALTTPVPTKILTPSNIASSGNASLGYSFGGTILKPTVTETIKQTSASAIINFLSFNVGSSATVDFVNKSTASSMVTLAQIGGNSASQIFGKISDPNGTLILANGNGITFENGSTVSVGGLIATASAISSSNFNPNVTTNTFAFAPGGNGSASVTNNGTITSSGLVALVAPEVVNNGTINANVGTVILASGDTATSVDLYGDGLLSMTASGNIKDQLVENTGTINSNGGQVILTASAAEAVVDSQINLDSIVQAENVETVNGQIVLTANSIDMGAGSSITTNDGSVKASGGSIEMDPGSSIVTNGGNIKLAGQGNSSYTAGVYLNDATLNAGNGGNISISGTGYNGASSFVAGYDYGVELANASVVETSGSGKISIFGQGGGQDAANVSGNNYGVFMITPPGADVPSDSGDVVSSDSGNIKIVGIGGGAGSGFGSGNNYGVYLTCGTEVYSNSGNVKIFGQGGNVSVSDSEDFVAAVESIGDVSPSGNNYGVFITSDAEVLSTSGNIKIVGIGGGDNLASDGNYGIVVTDGATIGSVGDSGNIVFVTDTISMDNTATIETTGDVFFEPLTSGTNIGVGGSPADEAFNNEGDPITLQLTNTVLGDVNSEAASITVGNTFRDSGTITANGYTWQTNVNLLNDTGSIEINGMQTMGNSVFLAEVLAGNASIGAGSITLGANGGVNSTAEGTSVTLADSYGDFINNNASPTALDGRWLVYSYSPLTDVFGNLDSGNTAIWDTVYPTSITVDGDRYVFAVEPALTVTFNDLTKFFGQDYTSVVASDGFTSSYTIGGAAYDPSAYLGVFLTTPPTFSNITSAGSPPPAPVGAYPDIGAVATVATNPDGYTITIVPGTLTVDPLDIGDVLEHVPHNFNRNGPYGTLLSIVNGGGGETTGGNLADLSPHAGGDNPTSLAELSPQAGGAGNAGITPLIQCNEVTPCGIDGINQ
jgi:filamentous hemagglutinin family protein